MNSFTWTELLCQVQAHLLFQPPSTQARLVPLEKEKHKQFFNCIFIFIFMKNNQFLWKAIHFSSNTVFHLLHQVLLLALNPPTHYSNVWSTERSQGKTHNTLFSVLFSTLLTRKILKQMHSLETAHCCLPHNSHLNSGVFRGYQSLNCFTLLFKTSLYTSAAFTVYSSTQTFMFCTTAQWNVILKLPINVRWKMPFPNAICNLH